MNNVARTTTQESSMIPQALTYHVSQVQHGTWVRVGIFTEKKAAQACRATLKKSGVEGSRITIRDNQGRLVK